MTEHCAKIDAFVDGMLAKEEADAFRAHLGWCPKCPKELRELAKLEAIASVHAEERRPRLGIPVLAPVVPIAKHPAWGRRIAPLVVVLLVAAAGWAILLRRPRVPADLPSGPVALVDSPRRSLEARLAYGPADRYRPYEVERSTQAPHGEHVSLGALARLEQESDFRGLAAGLVLNGQGDRAAEYLDRAGKSPDVDLSRAVIAMGRGQLEDALNILEPILERDPMHAQALWNRALVLRDLHLELAAAEAFEKVAALGEPGWADEARTRAEALKAESEERAQGWHAALVAGQALVQTGALPPDEVGRRYPSYLGRFLRHALRAAPSRERVLALLPLAKTLDGNDADGPLVASVNRMASGNFLRRAPLATEYGRLFGKWMFFDYDEAGIDALLAKMRAAGEDDLFFGAVEMTDRAARNARALVKIAASRHDPWLDLVAQGAVAEDAVNREDFASAEATLRAAIATCDAGHLDYLCATLELQLVDELITLARTADATAVAESGLRRSRRQAQNKRLDLESRMADVGRQRGAFPLMKAYLADVVLGNADNCFAKRQASEFLAAARLQLLDPAGARVELERGPRCDEPIYPSRVFILAELDRLGQRLPELDELPQEIARARPGWLASDEAWVARDSGSGGHRAGPGRRLAAVARSARRDGKAAGERHGRQEGVT